MAKRKKANRTMFKLSSKADTMLNKYIRALNQGILNVCEMHTHDSNPSLSQEDFELTYIEATLGKTCAAVQVSQRAIIDGLAMQKKMEAERGQEITSAEVTLKIKKGDN